MQSLEFGAGKSAFEMATQGKFPTLSALRYLVSYAPKINPEIQWGKAASTCTETNSPAKEQSYNWWDCMVISGPDQIDYLFLGPYLPISIFAKSKKKRSKLMGVVKMDLCVKVGWQTPSLQATFKRR